MCLLRASVCREDPTSCSAWVCGALGQTRACRAREDLHVFMCLPCRIHCPGVAVLDQHSRSVGHQKYYRLLNTLLECLAGLTVAFNRVEIWDLWVWWGLEVNFARLVFEEGSALVLWRGKKMKAVLHVSSLNQSLLFEMGTTQQNSLSKHCHNCLSETLASSLFAVLLSCGVLESPICVSVLTAPLL